ncbi:MAG: hypothetical protein R3344_09930, partial [Acidobacteriota bacterium]|nr:hypothetical protein [Acidobacteriota bacterium]
EGIGVAKYWGIEASPGSMNKGALVAAKSFDLQWDDNEATPDWTVRPEASFVGDLLGTGEDVIRILEMMPGVNPNRALRRVRHINVRDGSLIGSPVIYGVLD